MARKLSLQRDQRQALLRGLMSSLVLHESITTTEARAKEVAPLFEHIVTKAKLGTLHGARQVRSQLQTENAVQKLFQELTPAFAERNGGYTRIVKIGNRKGDNAPMVVLSLVLPANKVATASGVKPTESIEAQTPAKKTTAKTAEKK